MEIAIFIVCCLIAGMQLFLLLRGGRSDQKELQELKKQMDYLIRSRRERQSELLDQLDRQNETVLREMERMNDAVGKMQEQQQKSLMSALAKMQGDMNQLRRETGESLAAMNGIVTEKMQSTLDDKLNKAFETIVKNMSELGKTLREDMVQLRRENQESLDRIHSTVNDKLQKTLDDKISKSFETVSKRLAEVYEGLGEMKSVASGVSDLKNVLSNVKNRGIMGELQLGAILREILAPEQFGEQIPVTPGGSEKVDFAVKLPGLEEGSCIWLPIDSKFPGDTYAALMDAYESGDPELLRSRRSLLEQEIKKCAKSIRDKYIVPPHTTDFAIMFLPFEGLYAEVVNMGLVEILQRNYKVNIAGPSTMAAMLNSLQMGFRTLAIQKKSGEVWQILEAAKKEFGSFETVLTATRNRLRQADEELEKLVGTRTRAINRRLEQVALPGDLPDTGSLPG